jgi:hypothetical protein
MEEQCERQHPVDVLNLRRCFFFFSLYVGLFYLLRSQRNTNGSLLEISRDV